MELGQSMRVHLVALLLAALVPGIQSEGRWIYVDFNYDYSYAYEHGLSLLGKNFIRGEVMTCDSAELFIASDSSLTDSVYFRLYFDYSYSAIVDGQSMAFLHWSYDIVLSCTEYQPYWIGFEGSIYAVGSGLVPFENYILYADLGRVINNNVLLIASSQTWGTGTWRWLVDEPPLFVYPTTDGNEVYEMSESTAQYTYLFYLQGTDPDDDVGTLIFSVTGDYAALFEAYSNSVYLMATVDYETQTYYWLTIQGSDGRNTVTKSLMVKILDEIDEVPVITANPLTISEELPVGTDIGHAITATDADKTDTLSYYLSGTHSEYLSIDSEGKISIAQVVDIEAGINNFADVTVTVVDAAGLNSNTNLLVNIYDVNDNTPVFTQDYYHVEVDEGTASGTVIGTIGATDADVTNSGLTTSLLSQNGATSGFSFSLSNFDISTAAELDYEAMESINFHYVLVVQVVDSPPIGDALTSTAVVKVTVNPINEHDPTWTTTSTYSATVSEDALDTTTLVVLDATDDDLGDEVVYSIQSVTPASGAGQFVVDTSTGEVKVGGRLDFDTGTGGSNTYTLAVRASDHHSTPKYVDGTATITLTGVNDNAPHFDSTSLSATLSEDSALHVDVTTINVNDYDGDTVTLSIENGDDGLFEIHGDILKYKAACDYETKKQHVMHLKATDGLHNSYISLVVNIQDVSDEAPIITFISSTSMAERQAIGTALFGGYIVSDPDVGDVLSYAIGGTDSAYVTIDANTGLLTVAQEIDYDAGKTQLDLTLTVSDPSGLQDSESFSVEVVDINDLAPLFDPNMYEVEVSENSAAGISLGEVTVSDGDEGDNANYVISVESGGGGAFEMSGREIVTTSTSTNYESLQSEKFTYTLVIIAIDQPTQGDANTGSAIVKVSVTPENEFDPVWTTPVDGSGNFDLVTVPEDTALGAVVGTFAATDDDLSIDGDVTYSIASITGASGAVKTEEFCIEPTSGELLVAKGLDVDTHTGGESSYSIVIRASDGGTPALTVDGTITVTLTNVNDIAPVFSASDYTANVAEDAVIGHVVTTLDTTDPDGDAVSLSIISGDTSLFELDGHDVKVKAALDYETTTYYVLVVRATDGVFNTDVPLQIDVVNVVDNAPVITMESSSTMSEHQAATSGVIGGFVVTDVDGDDDTLTHTISGTHADLFGIDQTTGQLYVLEDVDREGPDGKLQLDLVLTVTDAASLTTSQDFSITVVDINDQSPVFSPSEFTAEIIENSAPDISLLELTCSDGDEGVNAQFDVTIASGDNGAGVFKMVGLELHTASNPPDYEALGASGFMYTLVIIAVDTPAQGEANTGTAIVRVSVKPENEHAPVWTAPNSDGSGNFDDTTMSEGALPGTVVTTLVATDDDLGTDGIVSYTLLLATDSLGADVTSRFSIDASTGELKVAGALDYDVETGGVESITVDVKASDNGDTPKTVEGHIVLTLTNINDNPPYFDQSDYSSDVSEAEAVGFVVATLNVNDIDGDVATLSVASRASDLFECDGMDVKIKSGLDYETATFHILIIRASDGIFETDVPLQVNVHDASDEVPVITMVATAVLSEQQAVDTGVYGGYVVTDTDAGDEITFTLSGVDSNFLTIDSTNGELTMAEVVDREGPNARTSLTLTLTVEDKIGLQASEDFTILVADINDLPPVFDPIEYDAEVTENTAAGVSIAELLVSDGDDGDNALFNLAVASGADAGLFTMVGTELQTDVTAIDYETSTYYTLLVTAIDTPQYGDANTATAIVRVTVKPDNEFTPAWTSPDPSGAFPGVAVSEDAELGHVLETFAASDDDGDDALITYSLVSVTGDTSGIIDTTSFSIQESSGNLIVAGKLDHDLDTSGDHSYTVVVRASDNGPTPKFIDGTIVISITNINDNPPKFQQPDFSTNVDESSPLDHLVFSFTVDEYDGDAVTLSVISGDSSLFQFDGNDLRLKGALDYETIDEYILFISASDGTHSTIVTTKVNVIDVIDEAPIITFALTASMSEEQTIGSGVWGGYVVFDADANDVQVYSLSGPDNQYLTIDTASGDLTVAQNVDRDAGMTSLSLTLTVTDQAGLSDSKDLTIDIEDINDVTPYFDSSITSVEIVENTPSGADILTLVATDDDVGVNSDITLIIESGDDTAAKFAISGQALQTSNNILDFETLSTYTLTITAVDTPNEGLPNTGTTIITVTVLPENEYSPIWETTNTGGNFDGITVDESVTPGTVLTTLFASDQDLGNDGEIVYGIVSITSASGASVDGLFVIDESRGNVSAVNYLDFDIGTNGEDSYTIVFSAIDKGTIPLAVEGQVVVTLSNVNDNAPTLDQSEYYINIDESAAIGDVVWTFNTEDFDNDALTLSIESGPTTLFEVDGMDLKVKAALDFENEQFYVLRVRATDGLFNTDVAVHVDVNDVIDEPPVITIDTTASMTDKQKIGTFVYGGYSVNDPDVNDNIVYSLTGADSSYLNIDTGTGVLTVAQNIDLDAGVTSLTLTLIVTDDAGFSDSKDFSINVEDINDKVPYFTQSVFRIDVAENTLQDVSLLDLPCSDDDTSSINAQCAISIGYGDDSPSKFKVVGDQLQTGVTPLDFEDVDFYTLIITAVDAPTQGEKNTGTTVVMVTVTSENEHDPVFTSPDSTDPIDVKEDVDAGYLIATFVASDADAGDDGEVTYSITSVTTASGDSALDLFTLDEKCGTLKLAGTLDAENGDDSYTINVKATDGGATPRTADIAVTMNVLNVNDNPPYFDDKSYETTVAEDAAVGDVILNLGTGDDDGDTVTLSILTGRTDLFELDGNNVILVQPLDFEDLSYHLLVIQASDGLFQTEVSLQVNVDDVIDETPVITMVTAGSMTEESTIGSAVDAGYLVTDADVLDVLTYALSGADSSFLTIDSSNGELSVAQHVDRDGGKTQLDLTLTVTDQSGLQAIQDFSVSVLDINDETPICNPHLYEVDVVENSAPDLSLVDISCTDNDDGANAEYTLTIDSGDDSNKFKIVGNQLQTDSNAIDYEETEAVSFTYTLIIFATDTPEQGSPNTGIAVVKVTVLPENEFSPVWTSPDASGYYQVTVVEDATVGDAVVTLQATDDDAGDDGIVTYSIISATGDTTGSDVTSLFSVDSKTGQLIVAGQLDSDLATGGEVSYTLVVRASDSATTPNTLDGTIVITPTNFNDNSPTFAQDRYEVVINEDHAVGNNVVTIDTSDVDGDSMTLSITFGRDDLFELTGNDLLLKVPMDFETERAYVLHVKVQDYLFDKTVTVHVTIADVNDEPPSILTLTQIIMSEGQSIGTGISSGFIATDADAGDVLTYSVSGAGSSYITMDTTSGLMTVADHVDRDGTNGFSELPSMTLTVRDQVGNEATKEINILVTDINDLPPIFNPNIYTVDVEENTAAGVVVAVLTVSDADDDVNGVFTLSVASGDDVNTKFTISTTNLLTDVNAIDYETVKEYSLVIHAVDTPSQGDARSATAVVKVNVLPVNEFPPVWTAPSHDGSGTFDAISISEDTPLGTVLTTFEATDDDDGLDGAVTFSLVSATGDTTGSDVTSLFSVDSESGQLVVAGQLDSDLATGGEVSYTLVVRASDSATTPNTLDGTIVITPTNVNDNAPTFDQTNYVANISEDASVGDGVTAIPTIPTSDADADAVTLTFESGNDDDLFEINGNIVNVKPMMDYENRNFFVLVVRANDGIFDSYVSLVINVLDAIDNTPVINMISAAHLSEGSAIGTVVNAGWEATDADVTDELTYTISGTDSSYFAINSSTGLITVADDVDREGANPKTTLTFTLSVKDLADVETTEVITVTVEDINDSPPTCNPAVFSAEVTENAATDGVILDLTCSDEDSGDNANFNVIIGSGDDAAPKFKMVGLQLQTNSNPIDYESLKDADFLYTLIITAIDTPSSGNALTGTAIVKVTVKPLNEHEPLWSSPVPDGTGYFDSVTVDEDAPPGTPIVTLLAVDDDLGPDGEITYEITSIQLDDGTNAADTFVIGATSGDLQVKTELDADGSVTYYDVAVKASDGGTSANEITAALKVYVNNVNDQPPSFSETKYAVNVSEDTPSGYAILTLTATDPDGDSLTFNVEGAESAFFICVGDELRLLQKLDYESNRYHSVIVSATDSKHTIYVDVIVTVLDVIDEFPVITFTTYELQEELQPMTPIGHVYRAEDTDIDDSFLYSLSGLNADFFAINESSGFLTIDDRIDSEVHSGTLGQITLTVTDEGGHSSDKQLNFDLIDINDNPPIFSMEKYITTVTENTPSALSIMEFTVTDADTGPNGEFTLSVISGDDSVNPKFSITGTTLYADATDIDYETIPDDERFFSLTVVAEDQPVEGNSLTGVTSVLVVVSSKNEYDPEWETPLIVGDTFPDLNVSETSMVGTVIGNYSATDQDAGQDGYLDYEILTVIGNDEEPDSTKFKMIRDEDVGRLIIASTLDADGGIDYYTVTISAVDGSRMTSRSATGTVTVWLINEDDAVPAYVDPFGEEKWGLRAGVFVSGAILGVAAIYGIVKMLASFKKQVSPYPNRHERPMAAEEVYDLRNTDMMPSSPPPSYSLT